jgi:hypothetical protein
MAIAVQGLRAFRAGMEVSHVENDDLMADPKKELGR